MRETTFYCDFDGVKRRHEATLTCSVDGSVVLAGTENCFDSCDKDLGQLLLDRFRNGAVEIKVRKIDPGATSRRRPPPRSDTEPEE